MESPHPPSSRVGTGSKKHCLKRDNTLSAEYSFNLFAMWMGMNAKGGLDWFPKSCSRDLYVLVTYLRVILLVVYNPVIKDGSSGERHHCHLWRKRRSLPNDRSKFSGGFAAVVRAINCAMLPRFSKFQNAGASSVIRLSGLTLAVEEVEFSIFDFRFS